MKKQCDIIGGGELNEKSEYIYISRSGYSPVSGSQWKCTSGCKESNLLLNQTTTYNATNLCNASDLQTAEKVVIVKVNWKAN